MDFIETSLQMQTHILLNMLFILLVIQFMPVTTVTDTRSNTGLTVFPNNITADTTKLMLTTNSISTVPDNAVDHLVLLYYLGMAENSLTIFPNLTGVGNTLTHLYLYGNLISSIPTATLEALVVLDRLSMQDNLLTSFPEVTSGPCYTLNYLNLATNALLVEPPQVQHYTNLGELWLHETSVTSIPDLWSVRNTLTTLRLHKTPVPTLSANYLSVLKSLTALYVYRTPLDALPTLCSQDISSVNIRADPLTPNNLDICACEHVWLKTAAELGGDIRLTDVDCGGIMWSAATSQQLLDNCNTISKDIVSTKRRKIHDGFFCAFPLHSHIWNTSLTRCSKTCLEAPGCTSFNFRVVGDNGRKRGDCVIIAPGGNTSLVVQGSEDENWEYFIVV